MLVSEPQSERGGAEHKHTISPSCSSHENIQSVPTSSARREIERKLGQMEDYLDGFYTKAKSDVRDMKKLFRDEILPTSCNNSGSTLDNPSSPQQLHLKK